MEQSESQEEKDYKAEFFELLDEVIIYFSFKSHCTNIYLFCETEKNTSHSLFIT